MPLGKLLERMSGASDSDDRVPFARQRRSTLSRIISLSSTTRILLMLIAPCEFLASRRRAPRVV
jgi:hypothetical protein